jgi:hypothetical protein
MEPMIILLCKLHYLILVVEILVIAFQASIGLVAKMLLLPFLLLALSPFAFYVVGLSILDFSIDALLIPLGVILM